jgi:ribonuclease VapC
MILDTSAVVALIREELEADVLLEKVKCADWIGIGAPTLVEATVVLGRRFGSSGLLTLERFLKERDVSAIPFEGRHWRAAQGAFIRFGKGRHNAGLNLGDCMSYATAKVAGEPLLFIGNDFARTDIAPA